MRALLYSVGLSQAIETLSDPLPAEPLTVLERWLAEAWRQRQQRNPNALVLATSDASGRPSARVLLPADALCVLWAAGGLRGCTRWCASVAIRVAPITSARSSPGTDRGRPRRRICGCARCRETNGKLPITPPGPRSVLRNESSPKGFAIYRIPSAVVKQKSPNGDGMRRYTKMQLPADCLAQGKQ